MLHADFSSATVSAEWDYAGRRVTAQSRNFVRLWSRDSGIVRVSSEDSAVLTVTDFSSQPPRTTGEDFRIVDALREMICAGVRALLVMRGEAIIGLITAADIAERCPEAIQVASTGEPQVRARVKDMMMPWDRVPVLRWATVCTIRVREMETYFKDNRATHVALVEELRDGELVVRGLASRTRLERQLGYRL